MNLPAKSPKSPKSSPKGSTKDLTETNKGENKADPLAGIEDLVEDLPENPPKEDEAKTEEIIEDIDASSFDLSPKDEPKVIEKEPEAESSPEEIPSEGAEPEIGAGEEDQTAGDTPEEITPEEQASEPGSPMEGEIPSTSTPADDQQPFESGEVSPPPPASEEPPAEEKVGAETEGSTEGATPAEAKEIKFETEVAPTIKTLDEKSFARAQIEAALFVSDKPVSVEDLSIKLEIRKTLAAEMIKDLIMDYMDRITSLEIVQIGDDTYTMQIRPEYTSKVKKFASGGLIPEGAMRTLTIIALKQPISKSLLVKLRGSGAYEHVKDLEDRGLVRSERSGRTQNVTTTDQFADMFGLSRDVKKMKMQLKAQLGVKEDDAKEDNTPPPPPPVPE